jgi:hypothetical protein
MLDFIVVGLPRSGTAWMANLLNVDNISYCVHDPLIDYRLDQLDEKIVSKDETTKVGVSCTGLWYYSDWLNKHKAKKLVIHRNLRDINESLKEIGLPTLNFNDSSYLRKVKGLYVEYEDLFDIRSIKYIWSYLTDMDNFNEDRFNILKNLNVQRKIEPEDFLKASNNILEAS